MKGLGKGVRSFKEQLFAIDLAPKDDKFYHIRTDYISQTLQLKKSAQNGFSLSNNSFYSGGSL